jgi:hypothetical protein
MKLYHFTAAHLIDRIKKEGITLGGIPLSLPPHPRVEWGYQWLTSNPDFKQAWCDPEYKTLPYNRNDYRITVSIPKTSHDTLIRWIPLWERLQKYIPIIKHLNDYGDPENWYVFYGRIPMGWFREITINPEIGNKE